MNCERRKMHSTARTNNTHQIDASQIILIDLTPLLIQKYTTYLFINTLLFIEREDTRYLSYLIQV